jgi:hypothetical protein
MVTIFAGAAGSTGIGDGPGTLARFNSPFGLAADNSGNIYVADSYNHTIRKITPAGVVSTLAGTAGSPGSTNGNVSVAQFNSPRGIAVDTSGNIYVADTYNAIIRKITPAGTVSTLAGLVGQTGWANGLGTNARFNQPWGLATDSSGNIYVADPLNFIIRKITPAGLVSTIAGSPGMSGSANGVGSAARFSYPSGVAVDSAGNVYVADNNNDTIRKISPSGNVTTFAGSAGMVGTTDATGGSARFDQPEDIVFDGSGNGYVVDTYNSTIRSISLAGAVGTLAGVGGQVGITDGLGGIARFNHPWGITVTAAGTVYVADTLNSTIRKMEPGNCQPTGVLDGAGGGIIGGWAYDPDYAGSIRVNIYLDGSLVQVAYANNYRSDLVGVCPKENGYCGFTWNYSSSQGFGVGNFNGTGKHQLIAYGVGVDASGLADGQNVALSGSPKAFTDGCSYLGTNSDAIGWCNNNPSYWTARQTDTTLLGNDGVHVGVDKSYGGAIFQLQGENFEQAQRGNVVWGKNLLTENGGGAQQLSLWGYDSAATGFTKCFADTQRPIWNPIQAQGQNCGWADTTNDVTHACYVADDNPTSDCSSPTGSTYFTQQDNPNNFTLIASSVSGLTFKQWVTPYPGYVKVRYQATADPNTFNFNNEHTSPVQWSSPQPQEIPALFTSEGISASFFSYIGSSPYSNDTITTFASTTTQRFLKLPNASYYPHDSHGSGQTSYEAGCATENWWGVCDANQTNCVTVATFDDGIAEEGSIYEFPSNAAEGYISPIGSFGLQSGVSYNWSVYVFPYRYDQVPYTNTQTTRQIIYQLAAAAGVNNTGRTCN